MNVSAGMEGMLRVRLTSADISGALAGITAAGIPVLQTHFQDELTVDFTLNKNHLSKLERIARRNGNNVQILNKTGLYWTLTGFLHRPILILGLLALIFATIFLPQRVFFLRVEGNQTIPARSILAAAEKSGVTFGARREEIRSERVKNEMLERLPQLQWAGINTYGCVGVISVRERAQELPPMEESIFGHVVAIRDGVVISCDAVKGQPLCVPGQAVREGEILISGYTDCGLTIRAEQAQGEVYGNTFRSASVRMPLHQLKKAAHGNQSKKISLLIGKKRINLWKDSGIWDTVCDRMYEEYYVTLPGGFRLPVAICLERMIPAQTVYERISPEQAEAFLGNVARDYLTGQMVGGSILQESRDFEAGKDIAQLTGKYVCTELIGRMQREKIGESNGQSD